MNVTGNGPDLSIEEIRTILADMHLLDVGHPTSVSIGVTGRGDSGSGARFVLYPQSATTGVLETTRNILSQRFQGTGNVEVAKRSEPAVAT